MKELIEKIKKVIPLCANNPFYKQEILCLIAEGIIVILEDIEKKKEDRNGRCCYCGTREPEESPCPKSPDNIHCNHWWDGPIPRKENPQTQQSGD